MYADSAIAVVDKPPELLTCTGTSTPNFDCVTARIRALFAQAVGPILVHRLDQSTSGLLVVALTEAAHASLSQQFARHGPDKVSKGYTAEVAGVVGAEGGLIVLPLRLDWPRRPLQIVDFERGKPALTRWRRLSSDGVTTRIDFEPVTGRTHQLRVHAADPRGLGTPIVGDRLYGTASGRLRLHASRLSFVHPVERARVEFVSPAPF